MERVLRRCRASETRPEAMSARQCYNPSRLRPEDAEFFADSDV